MEFTRPMLAALRDEIETALAAVAANNPGLSIKTGRGSFTASTFSLKIEMALGGDTKERRVYRANAEWLQLPPLDTKVSMRTREGLVEYTTNGLNSTASKVLMLGPDGRNWLFKPEDVAKRAGTLKPVTPTVLTGDAALAVFPKAKS